VTPSAVQLVCVGKDCVADAILGRLLHFAAGFQLLQERSRARILSDVNKPHLVPGRSGLGFLRGEVDVLVGIGVIGRDGLVLGEERVELLAGGFLTPPAWEAARRRKRPTAPPWEGAGLEVVRVADDVVAPGAGAGNGLQAVSPARPARATAAAGIFFNVLLPRFCVTAAALHCSPSTLRIMATRVHMGSTPLRAAGGPAARSTPPVKRGITGSASAFGYIGVERVAVAWWPTIVPERGEITMGNSTDNTDVVILAAARTPQGRIERATGELHRRRPRRPRHQGSARCQRRGRRPGGGRHYGPGAAGRCRAEPGTAKLNRRRHRLECPGRDREQGLPVRPDGRDRRSPDDPRRGRIRGGCRRPGVHDPGTAPAPRLAAGLDLWFHPGARRGSPRRTDRCLRRPVDGPVHRNPQSRPRHRQAVPGQRGRPVPSAGGAGSQERNVRRRNCAHQRQAAQGRSNRGLHRRGRPAQRLRGIHGRACAQPSSPMAPSPPATPLPCPTERPPWSSPPGPSRKNTDWNTWR
jgi:hypothetical protein